ncbi:hypothetical protein EZS27_018075 [termite gut metagenome]|uniref:GTPase-associated system helical domain-containing protein n=1 Tax=termite gut metagenome TaxID=433724 RepID=A0A5J4RIU4_9ZZZZ
MNKTILQSLLDAQIFSLPDNDERLAQLEQSASHLAKKLKENLPSLPYYTLVALDPKITGTEPIIIEVEDVIKEYWTTIRSRRPESPVSIIRSVILSALNKIGLEDTDCAQIIYLTATNFYPYAVLENEKDIVKQILLSIGGVAEQNANKEWSLADEIPTLKLPALKIAPIKVNKPEIKADILTSAFETTPIVNQYQSCPSYTSVSNAFNQLKTNVPSALSVAINDALTSLVSSFDSKELELSINKFFTDFKKSLDAELKASFTAMQAVERRSRLLWWKEASYSQHLEKSYREIDRELRPIVMAYDLYEQLPDITPVSVDYLLRDTLFQLNDKSNETIKFSDALSAIETSAYKSLLQGCFNGIKIEDKERRISITNFIYLLVREKINAKDVLKHTGIDPQKNVTPCDLSVMILHDLLSNRIAES